ncbi:threonine--tRNA ligase [bacterium]|nr:threonine--tRNA ligase [bacterium]
MSDQNNQLYKVRHSSEHVLMIAMRNLGYKFHMAMGPATDDGFYFDFELLKGTLTEEDFSKIEKEMLKVIKSDQTFIQKYVNEKEAREMFKGNPYKQEWVAEIIKRGEKIGTYTTGDFVDICAGPHVKSTKEIGAVKLLSIAGAYWRGSEKNKMLTRIYGTAFESKEELTEYLALLEEAKKRDHRKIGAQLDLFHYSDKVGQGLTLWTPNGTIVRDQLEDWAKETEKKWGYVRVATPHIGKEDLYITSGHLPYYKDDMYPEMEIEGENYYLKGMNCPHHFEIFNRTQYSYRDLPLRFAEYGTVYRYEQSGSLFGLMRVRAIAQNDAHIFCSEEDAEQEFLDVIKLHEYYYNTLGLTRDDYYIVIGLPSEEKKDKYHGDKKLWDKAEKMMRNAIEKSGIKCIEDIGGAAFYGPKIDFNIKSAIGREFSISTNQLDLYMPTRFNLQYVNDRGEKAMVAVIHRAPLGSHERFIGFLIEHFAGAFPVWLHPNQVTIIPISEKHVDYAKSIAKELDQSGIRYNIDTKDETMGNKIRKAQEQKVPYMIIVGDKELDANTISVRYRDGEQENAIKLDKFVSQVEKVINSKSLGLK